MKNIRIGNDIRMIASIKGLNSEFDQNSVKQIRAFLVNTADKEQRKINVDVCRCNCGRRGYHFWPRHSCPCGPMFCQAPLPNRFCWHNCWNCGLYNNFCHHCPKSHFIPDEPLDRYLAPSRMIPENKVEIYFPADDQRECGIYKLIMVVSLFETGWGRSNVHTYTVDYGEVFILSTDDGAETGYISIDVDNDSSDDGSTPDGGGSGGGGDIANATVNTYGKVRLAQDNDVTQDMASGNQSDKDDVVTAKVFYDNSLHASVQDGTLHLDIGSNLYTPTDHDGTLDPDQL